MTPEKSAALLFADKGNGAKIAKVFTDKLKEDLAYDCDGALRIISGGIKVLENLPGSSARGSSISQNEFSNAVNAGVSEGKLNYGSDRRSSNIKGGRNNKELRRSWLSYNRRCFFELRYYDVGDTAVIITDEQIIKIKMLKNGEFSVIGVEDLIDDYERTSSENAFDRLKKLVRTLLSRYLSLQESYMRVNRSNGEYYRANEHLREINEKLTEENAALKAQNRDYAFLRKVFGSQQIDSLLQQAHEQQKMPRSQRSSRTMEER